MQGCAAGELVLMCLCMACITESSWDPMPTPGVDPASPARRQDALHSRAGWVGEPTTPFPPRTRRWSSLRDQVQGSGARRKVGLLFLLPLFFSQYHPLMLGVLSFRLPFFVFFLVTSGYVCLHLGGGRCENHGWPAWWLWFLP